AERAQYLRLPDRPDVDTPLGVVRGRRHVVVASVDIPDLLGAADHRHGAFTLPSRRVDAGLCPTEPTGRCASARAHRRADAARRTGRELLVPTPPGGLPMDR